MKKTILFLIPFAALALSGCSLGTQPVATKSDQPGVPGGLASKNEKGSIWKSEDAGQTFQVRSTVDANRMIDKADILSIAFDPAREKSVILGTVDDGVFKTDDGGESWVPIPFPPKRIYSFIVDQRDPDNRMFVSGVVNGRGKIFRTDDAGTNWREVYTEPGSNTYVSSLAQDPWNADIIIAGTSAGTLLKSFDAGETWRNLGGKTEYGIISNIIFDVKRRDSVSFLSFTRSMYHSFDGGNTWIDWILVKAEEEKALRSKGKTIDPKAAEATRAPGRMLTLVADPSRSGVLYVGTTDNGIYRSNDDGKNWAKLNIIESAEKFPIRSIAIDPKDSKNIIFVAGKTFYHSTNEGATWSVTALNSDRSASIAAYDPFDSRFIFVGLRNMQ
jgi:photosystem II stability/assembly factor-like uncharacterized protein